MIFRFEPERENYATPEFSSTTPLPAEIYANEGVAQVMFFESGEICETSYKDRGGKCRGQHGVTLPKVQPCHAFSQNLRQSTPTLSPPGVNHEIPF